MKIRNRMLSFMLCLGLTSSMLPNSAINASIETVRLYNIKSSVLGASNYDNAYDTNDDGIVNVFDVIRTNKEVVQGESYNDLKNKVSMLEKQIQSLIEQLSNKEESKGNEFSDEDRIKLDSLENYDDTEINEKLDKEHELVNSLVDIAINEKEKLETEISKNIGTKVDKEEGKGLSSNDFTNEDKVKLDSLENYDDTEIKKQLEDLHNYDDTEIREKLDSLSNYDDTEIKKQLEGLHNYDDTEIREKLDSLSNYDDTEIKKQLEGLHNYDDIEIREKLDELSNNDLKILNEGNEKADYIENTINKSFSEIYISKDAPYTIRKLMNPDGSVDNYNDTNWVVTDYIDVSKTSKIKISAHSSWGKGICAFYDRDKNVISVPVIANEGASSTIYEDYILDVPSSAAYVALSGTANTPPLISLMSLSLKSNSLASKKVTLIGDSITENNFTAAKNWTKYLEEETGCSIQNLGISGAGFYNGNLYKNRIPQIESDTDIIGVAISFNDIGKGIDIGSEKDTEETTLCGYAYAFFTQLLETFPATPIIVYCQCPWAAYHLGGDFSSGGLFISEVKKICNKLGIPVYDDMYFNGSVLRPWNEANQQIYYKNEITGELDDTHPNSEGHKIIANYLIPKFEQNICK